MQNSSSQVPPKEELMIITTVEEIRKAFFKETFIVWYDPNINPNLQFIEELKTICDLKLFTDWKEAATYLRGADIPTCQVITSDKNGESLLKQINDLKNIFSIHIFSEVIDFQNDWFYQYPKIVSVNTEITELKENLKESLASWQKQHSSLRYDLPVYSPIFDDMDRSENLYLHLYLRGFVNFKNREQAKNDFVKLAKSIYGTNKHIEDFDRNYNQYKMEEILKWYTKECFFYKITNNCLRIATPDSIQYCRLILHDLGIAIKEKYQQQSKNFHGLLYRGAFMSDEGWTKLCHNVGKDIDMHGFLSTTRNKEVALAFIKDAYDKKAMITIIVPPSPEKDEQGFAEIREYSDIQTEDEVLFNALSRFTILSAAIEKINGKNCRHLVLLYGAQSMRIFTNKANPNIHLSTKSLEKCYLCQVDLSILNEPMVFVNLAKVDEYCCLNCLDDHQINNRTPLLCLPSSLSTRNVDLKVEGFIMLFKEDLNLSFYGSYCYDCHKERFKYLARCLTCKEVKKTYCDECLVKNKNPCIGEDHLVIMESQPFSFWSEKISDKELDYLNHYQSEIDNPFIELFYQAMVFFKTHKYKEAIEFYQRFLDQNQCQDMQIIASSYCNMGVAYMNFGKYQKAVACCSKAVEIQKSSRGKNNKETCLFYSNLGLAYHRAGDYDKALESFSKALEIKKAVSGEICLETAAIYQNYGMLYFDLALYQKAIEYQSKAVEIRTKLKEYKHPHTANSFVNIGVAYTQLGDHQKAIEYYSKALKIQTAIFGDKHPDTASCYNYLGVEHFNLGEYKSAMNFTLKALEIRKAVLNSKHPDLAITYVGLGGIYCSTGDYGKALEFLSKGLEIQKLILEDNHPNFVATYSNLATAYFYLGEYQISIDYNLKALEIRKALLFEKHPETANCYNGLAIAYQLKGENEKAVEYLSRAVEIQEEMLGDKHPSLATFKNNIGMLYYNIGKNEKALEFYLNALEIQKLYGEKHQLTALIYNGLGAVYLALKQNDKAIEFLSKACEILKEVLGHQHPHLGVVYNNIASSYDNLEDYQKAIEFYSKGLEILQHSLGDKHPNILALYDNIADLYKDLKEYDKALKYYSRALEISKIYYGDQHSETLDIYKDIKEIKQILKDKDDKSQ